MLYHVILLLSLPFLAFGQDCADQSSAGACYDSGGAVECDWVDETETCQPLEDAAECDTTDLSTWRVDPLGSSAQFRLVSTCSKLAIKVQMVSAVELDDQGDETAHRITSFASQDYNWYTRTDTDPVSLEVTRIINTYSVTGLDVHDYDEPDPNPIEFNLTTEVYLGDAVTTDTDTDTSNIAKFGVSIVNWPWYNDENTLKITLDVLTQRQKSDGDRETCANSDPCYTFADGWSVIMNTNAVIDGTDTTDAVTVNFDDKNRVHLTVELVVDHFVTSVDYDPYLFWESSVSRPMGLCALVAALVASLWML
jgi:hypothetical protein